VQRTTLCLWAILLPAISACAPKSYSLAPIETRSASIWLEDGTDYLISKKKSSVVIAASAHHTERDEFAVFIHASNDSTQNQRFMPSRHIKAFMIPDTGERTKVPLHVYSYDGFLELMESRHASAAAWNAFGEALVAASAGQGQSSSHTTASASYSDNYGYYGTASGTATTRSTYTDPVAQQLAQNRASRNIDRFNHQLAASFSSASNSILRRTTLRPGESVAGVAYIDDGGWDLYPASRDRFVLRVYVGEERHTLQFKRLR
jgi:hypothetical protein